MKQERKKQVQKLGLSIALLLLVLFGISYLKSKTDRTSLFFSTHNTPSIDTLHHKNMEDSNTVETIPANEPDSFFRDKRPPLQAGQEDGYMTGVMDQRNGTPHANYDEASCYTNPHDQEIYRKGYQEGYAKGLRSANTGHPSSASE